MELTRVLVLGCLLAFPLPQQSAPLERSANTTLRFPQELSSGGFATASAFPGLTFSQPVGLVSPPQDSSRLFIVEATGRIQVITNLSSPNKTLFLDLSSRIFTGGSSEAGLLGLAFHPGWRTNGYFFVFYTLSTTTAQGSGLHDRVSRFSISSSNPNQALSSSEEPLITQYDQAGNHNAGDLHFGPDGYLYVSLGDEGGSGNQYANAQRIDKDFFSGILRLDVDSRPGSLAPNAHPAINGGYRIPSDNPFVGASSFNGLAIDPSKVRSEFWAVGLRNPWRFSFDPNTGNMYCADVGQSDREEVNIIRKGGNYGWDYRDGNHSYSWNPPPAGAVLTAPILDYRRIGSSGDSTREGNCVIGGFVYRGSRFTELWGHYLFGDYASGNVWALQYDGVNATNFRRLTGVSSPSAFGADPTNGDVLIAEHSSGIIRRLVNSAGSASNLPAMLADTGAFANLASLTPNPGIVGYDLNVPFWSDNASKTRWFSMPNPNLTIGFSETGNWSFPTGTVWIKHIELELTNGVPASRRRLETRFLVRNSEGIYGVTYRWDSSQNNATLVPDAGSEETFAIRDGDTVRTQVWRYPSRSQCLQCHTAVGGLALGFNTAQLNRDHDYSGYTTNQIYALSDAGYFQTRVDDISSLRPLAHATNDLYSIEHRARSYLQANCVQCHQPGGAGLGSWDARIATPLSNAGIIDGPLVNNWGNSQNRVIKPGSVENSMLHSRISTLGSGRMPPLASSVLDMQAIDLMSSWITSLAPASKQNPTLAWSAPAGITYGTPLGSAQLNASANVPGAFTYNPAAGTILSAGQGRTLSVTFVPQDTQNYNTVSTSVLINVDKAPLTITADDKSKVYGQANPPLTARYNGFVNGDDPTDLTTPVNLSTTASQSSPAGAYPISASGAMAANYNITHINGTLTIQSASTGAYTYLALEGESATIASPMTIRSDTNASGGQYIVTTSYGSGSATFNINLPAAGTYYLWSRVLSVDWQNSFFVSVDGAADTYDTPIDPNWKWSLLNGRGGTSAPSSSEKLINPRVFQLAAGAHTIVFSGRELNTRLDRLVLTDDPNYVPIGGTPPPSTPPSTPVAPVINFTAPVNNASFEAPANISLQATASDSDGTVALIEFFQGGTKLGEATASSFSMTWSNVAAGSYTLTARATDSQGLRATSGPVNISVNDKPQTNPPSGSFALVLEAEAATLASPMVARADSTAFGGQYIVTTTYGYGSATFNVNLPAAGTYFIWCRVLAINWENSFFVSVDGADDIYDTPIDPNWTWSLLNGRGGTGAPASSEKRINPRTFQLAAGPHNVLFRGREPNTRLDRIVITDDPNYVPGTMANSAVMTQTQDPSLRLHSIARIDGGVRISFGLTAGVSPRVQVSNDLLNWQDLIPPPALVETNGIYHFVDTEINTTDRKYYRIQQR
jgi:uncharacterized repeat protein (TIGR03806 family)